MAKPRGNRVTVTRRTSKRTQALVKAPHILRSNKGNSPLKVIRVAL
ncbi:hypothetical protein HH1059_24420 [Halorhodospira halochloris]|uniref:Uncharacterized protein n=1 Tax=Halorhodospira halochloris TaxID=1052 RepID=A0A2Z6EZU0_HALHR|nr:hypothetical protein HH1059_24420 [Halorhodospira halochloris]